MIETMYIGSGDVHALLSGKGTKSHLSLLQRFVSDVKPYYNARSSPIDALRTGAILEDRYLLTLPENYFTQYFVQSTEMDVFKASLDFAKIEDGRIVDFDELKTCGLDDYLPISNIGDNNDKLVEFVLKHQQYKHYYNQVQEQLYCSGLDSCNLVFLSVFSYDNNENENRIINPNEYKKIRIHRDEKTIEKIKERGIIFQEIRNCYLKN